MSLTFAQMKKLGNDAADSGIRAGIEILMRRMLVGPEHSGESRNDEVAAPGPVEGGAPGSAHAATLPVGCLGAGADLGPVPAPPTAEAQR